MNSNRFSDHKDDNDDDRLWRRTRAFMPPCQVDESVRGAIQLCWMMIAPSNRTLEELEKQIRRILDRALEDFKKDFDPFV